MIVVCAAVKFYRFREPFYSTHIVSIKTRKRDNMNEL